jgi:YVTN family beta-propeller protein
LPSPSHPTTTRTRRHTAGRLMAPLLAACGLMAGALTVLAAAPAGAATSWTGYVANATDGTISVLTANGPATVGNPITAGSGAGADPAAVAVNGNQVFVANYGDDTVGVLNAASKSLVATIPVGNNPVALAVSPDGSKVLVANDYDNTVSVINATTDVVTGAPISIAGAPTALATGTISGVPTAFVVTRTTVVPVNLNTMAVGAAVVLPNTPVGSNSVLPQARAAALTPDNSTLYVADFASGEVDAINTGTSAITQIPSGNDSGSEPAAVAVGTVSGTTFAYVANFGEGTVSVIQEGQTTPSATLSLGSATSGPDGIAVTPDGSTVVAVEANTGLAADISANASAASDAVTGTTLVGSGGGSGPSAIAFPPPQNGAPSISVSTTSLPAATVGVPYSAPLSALGGVGPNSWSVTTGGSSLLNIGLSLSGAGLITGTPTVGTATFTVTATDADSQTALSGTLTIVASVISITSATTLPNGAVGSPYPATTLVAAGGIAPYAWSGTAPFGLTLNSDGSLTGTPTSSGTSSFLATVTDSKSGTANTTSESFSVTVHPTIAVTPGQLPVTAVGRSYTAGSPLATVAATGGTAPFTFALSAGTLPPGLSLNSSTGAITGLVSGAGVFPFTIQVTDIATNTASQAYSLTAFGISTTSIPAATVGHAYTAGVPLATLSAVGGTAPLAWSSTTLPAGLTLNSGTGAITGTPTTAVANSAVTFTVTDSSGTPLTASSQIPITVNGSAAIIAGAGTPQAATVNTAFASAFSATVTDANGNPITGAVVTFTAPGSGASGTFPASSTTATATTNGSGIATSAAFTANGTAGSYTVTATTPGISGSAAYNLINNAQSGGPYSPLAPIRICDSRPGNIGGLTGAQAQCNGTNNAGSPIPSGQSKSIAVAGSFGVPANATAVVLNVTVVNTTGAGFLTVYPTGDAVPNASNLNYAAGEVIPNLVEVGVGTGGDVSLWAQTTTDVVVDLVGYVSATASGGAGAGLYNPLSSPARICDTRSSNPDNLTGPNAQCTGHTLAANTSMPVQVGGDDGVPSNATAAVLNVTVTNTSASGFITVYPQGTSEPNASNVNFTQGQSTSNRVIIPLSATGQIDVASTAGTDVIVDVSGYYTSAGGTGTVFTAEAAPVRICDTRSGSGDVCATHPIGAGGTLSVNVVGQAGVPANAKAVVINLTGLGGTSQTFLTVFPSGTPPSSSDLNLAPAETKPNLAVATLSGTGTITIFNQAATVGVIVDVLGWYS